MKIALGFLLLAVLAAAQVSAQAQGQVPALNHTMVWGQKKVDDVLLFRSIEKRLWRPLLKVTTDIYFPQSESGIQYDISCVKAIDQYQNGKGGYATLTAGGAGFGYVGINLKSQRSRGFNFIVEIYGKVNY